MTAHYRCGGPQELAAAIAGARSGHRQRAGLGGASIPADQ
jgi:hypothetical protein